MVVCTPVYQYKYPGEYRYILHCSVSPVGHVGMRCGVDNTSNEPRQARMEEQPVMKLARKRKQAQQLAAELLEVAVKPEGVEADGGRGNDDEIGENGNGAAKVMHNYIYIYIIILFLFDTGVSFLVVEKHRGGFILMW